jgi:tetratricopeptide (TPR) repeat protein
MSSPRTYFLVLLALLVFGFGLAAKLQPQFRAMHLSRADGDIFAVTLGDSRRMFANEFYTKADAYYHSGFYPTIYDNNEAFKTAHMAEDTGAVNSNNLGDETGFRGKPRDWLDAFARHFSPEHSSHLDEGGPGDNLGGSDNVREILPWLKLSTDLDPQNVQNYTVSAYWLRERMHKADEANQVLLEGLRNNPGSCDILFELGRLYAESYHDTNRAENVWIAAAKNWRPIEGDGDTKTANDFILERIATQLGHSQRNAGHWQQAIQWFQTAQKVSRTPEALQERIDEMKKEMAAQTNAPAAQPH